MGGDACQFNKTENGMSSQKEKIAMSPQHDLLQTAGKKYALQNYQTYECYIQFYCEF